MKRNPLESKGLDYRWVALAASVLAQVAAGSTTQGIPVLAAFFQVDLHMTKAQVGLLNSSSALGLMLVMMASGWMADRIGSRRMMFAGIVASGFALLLFPLVDSFEGAVLVLLLAGATTGIGGPAITRAVIVWFTGRDRGVVMGIQRTGLPLAGAIAGATLPSLALAIGWRDTIRLVAAMMIVAGLVVYALYRDRPVALGAAKGARPGNPLKLLRDRNLLLASVLPGILVGVQFCIVNYLVLYFMETLSAPVVVAGGALAVAQLGGAAGRIFWGFVSDRVFRGGRRDVLLLVGALSALLLGFIGFLPAGAPLWTVTVLGAALGMLTLGWHAVYSVFMPELAGRELAGAALGLGYTLLQVGSVSLPPLFGLVVDMTGDYRWGWRLLALLVALGSALLLMVKEPRRG